MSGRRIDAWLVAGLALLFVLLAVAAYGERFAPYEAHYSLIRGPHDELRPLPPGAPFPFGSDLAGRDLLSLILIGARSTLLVAVTAGLARLFAGIALAVLVARLRVLRPLVDVAGDLAAAIPSTLVAVLVVLAFSRPAEADVSTVIVALLVTGWAGPYRVAAGELRRLQRAPFTEGARALGVRPLRIVLRHQLPHLVPTVAVSFSQQVTSALVALAELGVLAVFTSPVRTLDLRNSVPNIRGFEPLTAPVTDRPEWGALLAMARGIEDLYLTRWTFLVPGLAIAFAAIAFAITAIGIARHYRRRDLLHDLRSRRALALALLAVAIVLSSLAVPPRHALARAWAADARAAEAIPRLDVERALRDDGLVPVAEAYAVERATEALRQTAPASLAIRADGAERSFREGWGKDDDFAPIYAAGTGGGTVDARVVFAGWGVAPGDYEPHPPAGVFAAADFATEIQGWADDYARVDVRGAVVLVLRIPGALRAPGARSVTGPDLQTVAANAHKRGAAALLFVDRPSDYEAVAAARAVPNPYKRLMRTDPPADASGMPAFLVTPEVADALLATAGMSATQLLARFGAAPSASIPFARPTDLTTSDPLFRTSYARELGATARLVAPLSRVTLTSRSWVAQTPGGEPALALWAAAPALVDGDARSHAALLSLLRSLRERTLPPLVVVLFDTSGDPVPDARAIASLLKGRRIDLVLGLDSLRGERLRFLTPRGDLQLTADAYARDAGVPYQRTTSVVDPERPDPFPSGVEVFTATPTLVVRGTGRDTGGLADDAAAFVGYVIGRYVEGAPELHR